MFLGFSRFPHVLQVFVVSSLLSGVLSAQDAQQQVSLPVKWAELAPAALSDTIAQIGLNHLSLQQRRDVALHVWDAYLSSDSSLSGLSPRETASLLTLFTQSVGAIRQIEGEQRRLGTDVYTPRIDAIRQRVIGDLSSLSSPFADYRFDDFVSLWSQGTSPLQARDNFQSHWSEIWRRGELTVDPQKQQSFELSRAQATANWMKSFDWKKLSTTQKLNLLEFLSADLLLPESFSVRYSGTLNPPAEGEYRFGSVQHPIANGVRHVSIGSQVVLNSSEDEPENAGGEILWGKPVFLKANSPVSIQFDYDFDSRAGTLSQENQSRNRFPMAILLWKTPAGEIGLVPETNLSQGKEFSSGAEPGLTLERFKSPHFQDSLDTITASSIQHIWDGVPIAPAVPQELSTVIQDLKQSLVANLSKEQISTADQLSLRSLLLKISPYLSVEERYELLNVLGQHPAALANLNPHLFSTLWHHYAVFPGNEKIRLLTTWAKGRASASWKLGESVESSPSIPFYATDHVGYNAIAKFVPKSGTELFHNFLVNELESSDGRPNIELITIVANRMTMDHKASEFRKWMASKLPESLAGDQLALWLVAQAWVEEALAGGISQAAVGLPYLEQARYAARGEEVRFRVLREIVFREITIGRSDVAFQQIQTAGEGASEAQQKRLANLLGEAKYYAQLFSQLQSYMAQHRSDQATRQQEAMLKERLQKALDRGDAAAASRYRQQLNSLASPR